MKDLRRNRLVQFFLLEPQIHIRILILILLIFAINAQRNLLILYYSEIEDLETKIALVLRIPNLKQALLEKQRDEERLRWQEEERQKKLARERKRKEQEEMAKKEEEQRKTVEDQARRIEEERKKTMEERERKIEEALQIETENMLKKPVLQGVVMIQGRFAVLLDDQVCEIGDEIKEYTVMHITKDTVFLRNTQTKEMTVLRLEGPEDLLQRLTDKN